MRFPWLIVAAFLAGCQQSAGPSLISLSGVGATELREGDALELRGQAFPEGREARITLRGEVTRAGQAPERGFELVLAGRSVSPHAVSVEVTRQVERAFSGVNAPQHATFRGTAEVAFSPRFAGTPPVTGLLPELVLDFVPAEGDRVLAEARREEGRRFAGFAGVLLEEGRGLVVDGVMPRSPAERAGVTRGDVLVELAGVRLLDISDLVPPPRTRAAVLAVQRPGLAHPARLRLDVEGFRPPAARDFAMLAGVMAAVVGLFGLLASPLGRVLSFFEWRLTERLRERRSQARPGFLAARRLPPAARPRPRAPALAQAAVLVLASAVVTALGFGRAVVAREMDVPLVLAAALVALLVAVLVFRVPGERGPTPRLQRAAFVLARGVPLAACLAAVLLEVRSFDPDDLALAQGVWPWEWLVFRSPAALGLVSLALISLVPEAVRESSPCESLEAPRPEAAPAPGNAVAVLVGHAELLVATGILALVTCGGTRVTSAPPLEPPLATAIAGALLLLLKTWALAGCVLGLRWLLGRIALVDARALVVRALVPSSLSLLAVVWLVERGPLRAAAEPAAEALSAAGVALVALLSLVLVRRALSALRGSAPEPGLNPWL